MLTPTGYRCKKCVRSQQKVYVTARTVDYPLAFFVAAILSFGGIFIARFLGFFAVFLAPVAGVVVAEAVRRIVRKRRGKALFQLATAGAVAGTVPIILPSLIGGLVMLSSARGLLWPAVAGVAGAVCVPDGQHGVLPAVWDPDAEITDNF